MLMQLLAKRRLSNASFSMKYLPISKKNIHFLTDFIDKIGNSSKTFRYFTKRDPQNALANHLTTFLLYDDMFVGYGHLDRENNKVWLGICVKEGCQGKGYGKLIMQKLVDSYNGDIDLSVDLHNKIAINLYKLFHFKEISQKNGILYMKRLGNE